MAAGGFALARPASATADASQPSPANHNGDIIGRRSPEGRRCRRRSGDGRRRYDRRVGHRIHNLDRARDPRSTRGGGPPCHRYPDIGADEREARRLRIPLSTLSQHDHIDITLDGADEVEVATLNLLKGRGGALLREKIVASASEHLIIIVDETKLVNRLGVQSAVVVEVVPFGWSATARKLRRLVTALERRMTGDGEPFITDGGHYILDCTCGGIADARV
jgi:hypothetical protein